MTNANGLYLAYDNSVGIYHLLRNNAQGVAVSKTFRYQEVQAMVNAGDGALETTLRIAREVPKEFHLVDAGRKPKLPANHPQRIPSRLVL
jgi:hypothetical protein